MSSALHAGLCIISVCLCFQVCSGKGAYCAASTAKEYCEYGCCGNKCCPNTAALVTGIVLGTIVLGAVIAIITLYCVQKRRISPYHSLRHVETSYNEEDISNPALKVLKARITTSTNNGDAKAV